MWQLHTGKEGVVPRALQALQTAYQVTHQQKGVCQQVAQKLHEGFRFLEGDPKYVHISSSAVRAQFMSWQNRIVVSDNNFHVVVQYQGRFYDAFTGPRGMPPAEYFTHLLMKGAPVLRESLTP